MEEVSTNKRWDLFGGGAGEQERLSMVHRKKGTLLGSGRALERSRLELEAVDLSVRKNRE